MQIGCRKIASQMQYLTRGSIYYLIQHLLLLKVFEFFLPCFGRTTYLRLDFVVAGVHKVSSLEQGHW